MADMARSARIAVTAIRHAFGKLERQDRRAPDSRKCKDLPTSSSRCSMGTIFEDSHVPMHLWLQVIHLMCASKKGISTRQIQRMLDCSMKTAWFLGHRIPAMAHERWWREKSAARARPLKLMKPSSHKSPKTRKNRACCMPVPASQVFSLVERGGNIRSHVSRSQECASRT